MELFKKHLNKRKILAHFLLLPLYTLIVLFILYISKFLPHLFYALAFLALMFTANCGIEILNDEYNKKG